MAPFEVPYISLPDGSVHTAKSKPYLELKPQADGTTNWQVIARPNHVHMKPFYFAKGSVDAEFSAKMKSGKFETGEASNDLEPLVQVGVDAIEPAADWGAVVFEMIAKRVQLTIPREGQGI